MSLEVLIETYGHHHRDFRDEAASAYGRRRAWAKRVKRFRFSLVETTPASFADHPRLSA